MGPPLTAIDLFAGCGGTSLALRASGIATVMAIEAAPEAATTYAHNLPDVALRNMGVEEINGRGLPHVDLIAAAPPIHGGHTHEVEELDYRKLAEVTEDRDDVPPRAVMIDLASDTAPRQARMVSEHLWSLGYAVSCATMSATDFGCAVNKRSLMLIGRRGNAPMAWPVQTHGPEAGLMPYSTVGDRLAELRPDHVDPWALLHDFPCDFHWCGARHHQGHQIAAATSVRLATAIGTALREE